MKFILSYSSALATLVLPIEAESPEQALLQFREAATAALQAQEKAFRLFGHTFWTHSFLSVPGAGMKDALGDRLVQAHGKGFWYHAPRVETFDQWFERGHRAVARRLAKTEQAVI